MLNNVYAWVIANKRGLLEVLGGLSYLATCITAAVPANKMPAGAAKFLGWLGALVPSGKDGLVNRFTIPLTRVKDGAFSQARSGVIGETLKLFMLCTLALSMTACAYCQVAANTNTALCKAERTISQCGPKALGALAQVAEYLIAQDFSEVFTILGQVVPDEAECIEDAIESKVALKYGPSSALLKNLHGARVIYKTNHATKIGAVTLRA